jgi:N-methylhydantoinase B
MRDVATKRESAVDPITFTVIWDSVNAICNEMGYHLQRTAFSELAREAADISAAYYDRKGRLIAQGVFSPGHLGAMISVIDHVVNNFDLDALNPGDAIVTNDIYIGAGQLSDTFTVVPVFVGEELFGFVGSSSHLMDVGGASPGSQMVTGVFDNYAEGVRIPPLKLFRGHQVNEELLHLITYNTRFPDKVAGDLRAMFNACAVGSRRILELVERYGVETMEACFEEILDRSEEQVRTALEAAPDGVYQADLFLDDCGPGTEPIKVACDVTIAGSEISVDWSRSSGQVHAGINSTLSYTFAYSYFSVKALLFPDVPQNAGCVRPFSVEAPVGNFFNPRPPAPGAGRAMTIHRHFEAISSALREVVPQRAIGASSQWCTVAIGGWDAERDRGYLYSDLLMGGFAARSTMDGSEGICTIFNSKNIPIEVSEIHSPVLVAGYGLVPDSGGAGLFRGACAIFREITVYGEENRTTPIGERHVFPPHGIHGGQDGGLAEIVLNPGTEEAKALHSKGITFIPKGGTVRFQTSGAGGYGSAFERDPGSVRADVRDGLVSVRAAAELYGVVLNSALELDLEATNQTRAAADGGQ